MAMMGSWQKKPLFKGPLDGGIGTPGYGDGLPMNDAPQWDGVNRLDFTMPEMPAAEAAPRQSFFGKGGAGRDALGAFFDAIAQQTGGQAVYMPARQHEKDRQQALDDYNRKLSDEMDLWRQKEIWKQQNPTAPNNDSVNDWNFYKSVLPPEQFRQYVANKINPPHFATTPDGRLVMVGGYQPGGGDPASTGQGQPPATLPPDFKFDEGGPTPQASGGFR